MWKRGGVDSAPQHTRHEEGCVPNIMFDVFYWSSDQLTQRYKLTTSSACENGRNLSRSMTKKRTIAVLNLVLGSRNVPWQHGVMSTQQSLCSRTAKCQLGARSSLEVDPREVLEWLLVSGLPNSKSSDRLTEKCVPLNLWCRFWSMQWVDEIPLPRAWQFVQQAVVWS